MQKVLSLLSSARPRQEVTADLLALSLVNKRSLATARAALYQRVHLDASPSRSAIRDFTKTISEHPWLALLVNEIQVTTLIGPSGELEVSTLACAISQCTSLRAVDIRGLSVVSTPLLGVTPYPLCPRGVLDELFTALSALPDMQHISLRPKEDSTSPARPICDVYSILALIRRWPKLQTLFVGFKTCGEKHCGALSPAFIASHQAHDNLSSPYLGRCLLLKHITYPDAMSVSQLATLSETAPNTTELLYSRDPRSMRVAFPTLALAPALRAWSDNLVQLILPRPSYWLDHRDKLILHFGSDVDDYLTTNIADIITQMPSLRVLGVPRAFVSPENFIRGPANLVWLDYYLPVLQMDVIVKLLTEEWFFPQLRHLYISEGEHCGCVGALAASLAGRRITIYETAHEWREALEECTGQD